MNFRSLLVLSAVLPACRHFGDELPGYYEGAGAAPAVSSVSPSSEEGNLGGQTVTLTGSGFGDDPSAITVQFASSNATVVSVSDSEVTVVVPRGPIEGGAVDVSVGTANGQSSLAGGYTFDVGDLYQDQISYVLVSNYNYSIYGGLHDESGQVSWADDFAFVGLTGVSGSAELLNFVYPRFHSSSVGWWGGNDVSSGWVVQTPGQLSFPSGIEDLRESLGDGLSLTNPALQGMSYCANLGNLANYTYGGGDPNDEGGVYDAFLLDSDTVRSANRIDNFAGLIAGECPTDQDSHAETTVYDMSTLNFCDPPAYAAKTHVYEADWAVPEPFFSIPSVDEEGVVSYDGRAPLEVELNMPEVGVEGVKLMLPGYPTFHGTQGWGTSGDSESDSLWPLVAFNTCFTDGDETLLDDVALRWEWEPATYTDGNGDKQLLSASKIKELSGPEVLEVSNKVRVTFTWFSIGWFGGEGYPMRVSTVVDDLNNFDLQDACDHSRRDDCSSLEMPASVLYQFPSITASWGAVTSGRTTRYEWGDPARSDYAYMVVTMERVTEYRLATDKGGELIFAYVAGDFGYTDWTNPLDRGSCDDCLDNDGDGWLDNDDPDCRGSGEAEVGYSDEYTCNDGIDNDLDGDIDSEDSACTTALKDETFCGDGRDNDDDGWVDDDDPDCLTGTEEEGLSSYGCNNGLDDDADGWIDDEDPDCESGTDDELGYGATACNNGLDDDGNGDIDAADIYCYVRGAGTNSEVPTFSADCDDGVDNDEDAYVDGADPGCEYSPYNSEGDAYDDPATRPATPGCYNNVDDDADGDVDAADTDCELAGEPNGYQSEVGP